MANDGTIDPEAYARYEQWRAKKIAGLDDLSVQAFNEEQLMLAAVWEQGRKAGAAGKGESANPHTGSAA